MKVLLNKHSTMKKLINKTALWFCITIITAIVLRILLKGIASGEMILMLNPTSTFLEVALDQQALSTQSGFYFPDLNITLDRSFSGENFFIIIFCLLSFTVPYHIFKSWQAISIYIGVLLASFILTILISSVRIISALPILRIQDSMPWINSFWMQRVEGGIIYLSGLLLVYMLFKNVFIKMKDYYTKHIRTSATVARMVVVYRRNSHQL
jgi:exosortase K